MCGKILIFFMAVVVIHGEISLPSYLEDLMCRKSDPNFSECFKTSLEKGFAYFVKGIEELYVPPLDPLLADYFELNLTVSESIDFSIVAENMVMTGIKGTIFQKVFADPIKLRNEINMLIPSLYLNLNYGITGKFLNIPIDMQGSFAGDFYQISIKIKSWQRLYEQNGVGHLAIDKLKIKLDLGDGKIRLTGSTPEQNTMAEFITKVFNDNPSGVVNAVSPYIIGDIEDMIMEDINGILAEIPASKLLPE